MTVQVTVSGPSRHGVRAAAASHGGRVRARNEDAFLLDDRRDLYAVSDGVGGLPGGQTASGIVVAALPELLEQVERVGPAGDGEREQGLCLALSDLSRTVREEAVRAGLAGMGATVVLAVVRGEAVTVAHLGDSRAYRLGPGGLVALTGDHSVVGILVRQGEISANEARVHPARGRITRFVGMEDDIDAETATVSFAPGDRLLLCSDGLTGEVGDERLAALLGATRGDPGAACRLLIEEALGTGARDNVTVVVADRPGDAGEE